MIGSTLGPYRIDRELGAGGMGTVWAATVEGRVPGLTEGTRVALKVVHPHLLGTSGFFMRFMREAEIGRAVDHENVVRTHTADALAEGGVQHHVLVMEYVEGQTLRGLLHELERVPEELCRHVGREVAKGLAAIHAAGAVHRDVKPENVLITREHVVKVMDLGVARLQDEALRLSQTGAFVGSIHYAAPECFSEGGRHVDGRADLHALGLVLYELASGVNPYLADDIPQILKRVLHEEPRRLGDLNPQLSPFFEEVVHCLLAKRPDERFADANALLAVLEEGEQSAWWSSRAKAIRAVTHQPLRRIRVPRDTAVHGREQDLAKLRTLYEKVKAGEGQVVILEGEAGIGKSRVVDELIARLHHDGEDLNFLFGSYPPGGAASAAGAFSTAFREQFGENGAAAYLPQTPLLVPAFEALLAGDAAPSGSEALTKDSIATCFVQAVRALAAERPTVLLIDDFHFAQEEARALFTSLAAAVPGHRVLLVGTTRPGADEKWLAGLTRLPQTSQVVLHRLGPKDLLELLRDSLKSDSLALSLAGQIAMKSDGNPFFAFEIIRGLREGQFISQRDDGTWVSTGVIGDIRIPSSVLDLVNARVADLTEEERDLLDVACCWGFEFDPGLVGDVVGLGRIPLLKRFGQIERQHRLVRASGRNYAFDHHQVQEALYGSLHEQMREEYHAALAGALEARTRAAERDPETLDGALCVDLCDHYLKGACGESALRYLAAAQAHLRAGYLNAQLIALTERALAVPGLLTGAARARALVRLSEDLDVVGRRTRQEECAREAGRLADEAQDDALRGAAAKALGSCLQRMGRSDDAEVCYRRALESARACGDRRAEASATGSLGNVFHDRRLLVEAAAHHERALELFCAIGDRRGEAVATGNIGFVLWDQGRGDEAQARYERQLALSREIGFRRGESLATVYLGVVHHSRGHLSEAGECFRRALALNRETGDRHAEAIDLGNLAGILRAEGRLAEAREHLERGLAICREVVDPVSEARTAANLASLLSSEERIAESVTYSEQAIAVHRWLGNRALEARDTAALSDALRRQGRLSEARTRCERALELWMESGVRQNEPAARARLAEVLREQGDAEASEGQLVACLALCEGTEQRRTRACVTLALGSIRAARGDAPAGRESLLRARDLAREAGAAGAEVLARCELALLPGGDAADALAAVGGQEGRLNPEERRAARWLLWRATGDRAHLAEAKRLLDDLLAKNPPEFHEAMRTNVRVHREILAACKAEGTA